MYDIILCIKKWVDLMKNRIPILLILTLFIFLVSCKKAVKHEHIFNEFYECINCDEIIKGYDFTGKTSLIINKDEYLFKIENIQKNKVRRSNSIVSYNYKQPLEVDNNGYEVAVNKYGMVVEVGTNVSMPIEGTVFSATGTYINSLNNIKVNDFIIYDLNTLYVYTNDEISKYHSTISYFYDVFLNIRKKGNLSEYQEELKILFNKLKNFYDEYNRELEDEILSILDIINIGSENVIDLYDHTHKYSYIEDKISEFNFDKSIRNSFSLYNSFIFKQDEEISIIKNDYEINSQAIYLSIDKYGIVIEKGLTVSLINDGYIIKGINKAKKFIINNVNTGDLVELDNINEEEILNIYKDFDINLKNNLINLRNNIVNDVNNEIGKLIPHDYEFILSIVSRIDDIINYHEYGSNTSIDSVDSYSKYYYDLDMVNDYINVIYSQLIDNNIDQTRGIWYYPFLSFNNIYLYDDTSLEGVRNTLNTMKDMGINNIFLLLFTDLSSGYLLYDSLYYEKLPIINTLSYGEYGNDYVLCFISEAHKLGMTVTAYTQTFYAHMEAMKDKKEEFHILDYYGYVVGDGMYAVQYYDVCNDFLQDFLIDYYTELVNKYDFDGIEYDFIRYPESNLSDYLVNDIIDEDVYIHDNGYTDYSMNKFMDMYNLEGDLKEMIRNSKEVRVAWLTYKYDELNNFVKRLSETIRVVNPEIKISAAVFPHNSSAIDIYMQDYLNWINEGYIDAIEPMNYTDNYNNYVNTTKYLYGHNVDVDIRVGIASKLYSENLLNDLKQVRAMDTYGDYVLFSAHYYYRDNTFVRLMRMNHHYPYLSSRSTEDEVLSAKCIDTVDMINNYFNKATNYDFSDLLNSLEEENLNKIIIDIEDFDDILVKDYLLKRFN